MARVIALLVLAAALLYGYNAKLHTPVVTPLVTAGDRYQSPKFITLANRRYDIEIGIKSVPTDEATCLAVRPKSGIKGIPLVYPPNQPCRALEPPMGAIEWVVKDASNGDIVGFGAIPGIGWQWPRPFEVARAWYGIGQFNGKPGARYVVILMLHDPKLPDGRYAPLFRVHSPYDTL